jgi:hypothetical protein
VSPPLHRTPSSGCAASKRRDSSYLGHRPDGPDQTCWKPDRTENSACSAGNANWVESGGTQLISYRSVLREILPPDHSALDAADVGFDTGALTESSRAGRFYLQREVNTRSSPAGKIHVRDEVNVGCYVSLVQHARGAQAFQHLAVKGSTELEPGESRRACAPIAES